MDLPVYETERLLIRPTIIEDAELVLHILNMPKWLEYIGDRNVHSTQEERVNHFHQTGHWPLLTRHNHD